ncbi:MAG: hypothetical protein IJ527_05975 [Prevotella sp.]|nr:hypothetical protein [Prevotella sp.]
MVELFIGMPLFEIRYDILGWIVGVLFIVSCSVLLWWQRREHRSLTDELKMIDELQSRSIEFDMVLKTMKLSIWKIDIARQMVTFGSDYREQADFLGSAELPISEFARRIHPDDRSRIHQVIVQMMEGKIDENTSQYRVRPFGADRFVWEESFCMVTEHSATGEPQTIVGTSMTIENRKLIEDELRDARNRAQESDRLKSAFLANISHEIRTPLNAIVGFSDILPLVHDDQERAELIRLIQENNRKLLRMIEDIVTMSKMEAGGSEVNKTEFDLSLLVNVVADDYRARNTNAEVSVLTEVPAEPFRIVSDRTSVTTILDQYMSNALKFTAAGTVTAGYDVMAEGFVRIWVRDTGKGIPSEKCNDVFDHFVKLDEFIPGTGLGLPICRATALMLGGRVGVESQLGQGSTFWAELPVR